MEEIAVKVTIDGQPRDMNLPNDTRFEEVMHSLNRLTQSPGIAITRVRLNGEDITGKSWDDFRQLSAAEISRLEVETGELSRLTTETLVSLDDFICSLIDELNHTAEQFRLGDEIEGNETYSRVIDGIQLVAHTTAMIQHSLGIDTGKPTLDGRSIAELLGNLEPIIQDMLSAQQDRDWILLADLIEYELIPHFEERLKILKSWAESTGE